MWNRTVTLSLAGSVLVGFAAIATYGESFPTLTAPNSAIVWLPAVFLAFMLDSDSTKLDVAVFSVAAVVFMMWTLPFATSTGPRIPIASRAFALLSIILGFAWLFACIPDATAYQARPLLTWYAFVDLVTAMLLLVVVRSNLEKPTASTFAVFHTVLFAWLFWIGAPAIGNLQGVEMSVDPALLQ